MCKLFKEVHILKAPISFLSFVCVCVHILVVHVRVRSHAQWPHLLSLLSCLPGTVQQ